ncbi:MAG: hypothetical protein R3F43_21535 [bacterium]
MRADALLLVEAPDLAEADYVWPLAAASADRRRLGLMLDALATASAPGLRALLVRSLGAVEDPVLLPEILAACLTPLFRPGELPGLLRPMSRHRRGREALHRWVDARLPRSRPAPGRGSWCPWPASRPGRGPPPSATPGPTCSPPARRSPVVDRTLRLSLEAADRTIRLNARASSALRLAPAAAQARGGCVAVNAIRQTPRRRAYWRALAPVGRQRAPPGKHFCTGMPTRRGRTFACRASLRAMLR